MPTVQHFKHYARHGRIRLKWRVFERGEVLDAALEGTLKETTERSRVRRVVAAGHRFLVEGSE